MPKGTAITETERRLWLDAHDHGDRIDTIARRFQRTERTVKVQIDRARKDRELRDVRVGLIKDAYAKHFEDLLTAAEVLRDATPPLPTEPTLSPTRRQALLRAALREHLPKASVWSALKQWEQAATDYRKLAAHMREAIGYTVPNIPAVRVGIVALEGWMESLWFASTLVATGRADDFMPYRVEHTAEGWQLIWGAYGLSRFVADEAELVALREAHEQQRVQVRADPMGGALSMAMKSLRRTSDTIAAEVEVLLLRRVFPGQCKLCPQ